MDFTNKIVLVTGGNGFLGKKVVERLEKYIESGVNVPSVICYPSHKEYDLCDWDAVIKMFIETEPDIVIHLAASVGGIGANKARPGMYFYDNAIMGIQLIECARMFNVEKFICIGTVCSYPKHTPVPFKEDALWDGYPEETNASYGLAKKMLLVQLQAYRQQYDFNGIYLLMVNLYGPGDEFNPDYSHVIPAMIRKFVEAKETKTDQVVLWGDGSPTREFLYVDDAADGIVLATEKYDKPEPVNLGAGFEISMKKLAHIIARLTNFEGEIVWDTSKPNGQPRRMLDVSRAEKEFGFKAKMLDFEQGLKNTIDWYKGRKYQ